MQDIARQIVSLAAGDVEPSQFYNEVFNLGYEEPKLVADLLADIAEHVCLGFNRSKPEDWIENEREFNRLKMKQLEKERRFAQEL